MVHRRVLSRANRCYRQLQWWHLSHHSQSPNYMQIPTINCLVHTPFKQKKSVKRESPHALPQFACTPQPSSFFLGQKQRWQNFVCSQSEPVAPLWLPKCDYIYTPTPPTLPSPHRWPIWELRSAFNLMKCFTWWDTGNCFWSWRGLEPGSENISASHSPGSCWCDVIFPEKFGMSFTLPHWCTSPWLIRT